MPPHPIPPEPLRSGKPIDITAPFYQTLRRQMPELSDEQFLAELRRRYGSLTTVNRSVAQSGWLVRVYTRGFQRCLFWHPGWVLSAFATGAFLFSSREQALHYFTSSREQLEKSTSRLSMEDPTWETIQVKTTPEPDFHVNFIERQDIDGPVLPDLPLLNEPDLRFSQLVVEESPGNPTIPELALAIGEYFSSDILTVDVTPESCHVEVWDSPKKEWVITEVLIYLIQEHEQYQLEVMSYLNEHGDPHVEGTTVHDQVIPWGDNALGEIIHIVEYYTGAERRPASLPNLPLLNEPDLRFGQKVGGWVIKSGGIYWGGGFDHICSTPTLYVGYSTEHYFVFDTKEKAHAQAMVIYQRNHLPCEIVRVKLNRATNYYEEEEADDLSSLPSLPLLNEPDLRIGRQRMAAIGWVLRRRDPEGGEGLTYWGQYRTDDGRLTDAWVDGLDKAYMYFTREGPLEVYKTKKHLWDAEDFNILEVDYDGHGGVSQRAVYDLEGRREEEESLPADLPLLNEPDLRLGQGQGAWAILDQGDGRFISPRSGLTLYTVQTINNTKAATDRYLFASQAHAQEIIDTASGLKISGRHPRLKPVRVVLNADKTAWVVAEEPLPDLPLLNEPNLRLGVWSLTMDSFMEKMINAGLAVSNVTVNRLGLRPNQGHVMGFNLQGENQTYVGTVKYLPGKKSYEVELYTQTATPELIGSWQGAEGEEDKLVFYLSQYSTDTRVSPDLPLLNEPDLRLGIKTRQAYEVTGYKYRYRRNIGGLYVYFKSTALGWVAEPQKAITIPELSEAIVQAPCLYISYQGVQIVKVHMKYNEPADRWEMELLAVYDIQGKPVDEQAIPADLPFLNEPDLRFAQAQDEMWAIKMEDKAGNKYWAYPKFHSQGTQVRVTRWRLEDKMPVGNRYAVDFLYTTPERAEEVLQRFRGYIRQYYHATSEVVRLVKADGLWVEELSPDLPILNEPSLRLGGRQTRMANDITGYTVATRTDPPLYFTGNRFILQIGQTPLTKKLGWAIESAREASRLRGDVDILRVKLTGHAGNWQVEVLDVLDLYGNVVKSTPPDLPLLNEPDLRFGQRVGDIKWAVYYLIDSNYDEFTGVGYVDAWGVDHLDLYDTPQEAELRRKVLNEKVKKVVRVVFNGNRYVPANKDEIENDYHDLPLLNEPDLRFGQAAYYTIESPITAQERTETDWVEIGDPRVIRFPTAGRAIRKALDLFDGNMNLVAIHVYPQDDDASGWAIKRVSVRPTTYYKRGSELTLNSFVGQLDRQIVIAVHNFARQALQRLADRYGRENFELVFVYLDLAGEWKEYSGSEEERGPSLPDLPILNEPDLRFGQTVDIDWTILLGRNPDIYMRPGGQVTRDISRACSIFSKEKAVEFVKKYVPKNKRDQVTIARTRVWQDLDDNGDEIWHSEILETYDWQGGVPAMPDLPLLNEPDLRLAYYKDTPAIYYAIKDTTQQIYYGCPADDISHPVEWVRELMNNRRTWEYFIWALKSDAINIARLWDEGIGGSQPLKVVAVHLNEFKSAWVEVEEAAPLPDLPLLNEPDLRLAQVGVNKVKEGAGQWWAIKDNEGAYCSHALRGDSFISTPGIGNTIDYATFVFDSQSEALAEAEYWHIKAGGKYGPYKVVPIRLADDGDYFEVIPASEMISPDLPLLNEPDLRLGQAEEQTVVYYAVRDDVVGGYLPAMEVWDEPIYVDGLSSSRARIYDYYLAGTIEWATRNAEGWAKKIGHPVTAVAVKLDVGRGIYEEIDRLSVLPGDLPLLNEPDLRFGTKFQEMAHAVSN